MKRVPLQEIQPLLLGVLTAFAHYCDKQGLHYFIDYGTLLGAVRHKGFIPWDDDVDVSMLRQDYDRLVVLAKESPYLDEEKRYRILLPAQFPNFYPFVKVIDNTTLAYERNIKHKFALGVWLDVFCLSQGLQDKQKNIHLFQRYQRCQLFNELVVCGNVNGRRQKLLYPFAALVGHGLRLVGKDWDYWAQQMLNLTKNLPPISYEKGSEIIQLSWPEALGTDTSPLAWWTDAVELEFEGQLFCAPAAYHEVLERHYGDYMQLPPEQDRVPHGFEAYYR